MFGMLIYGFGGKTVPSQVAVSLSHLDVIYHYVHIRESLAPYNAPLKVGV